VSKYRIAWLPGDGVGVEVMEGARICLDALKIDAEYTHGDIGWEFWRSEGESLPQRTIDLLHSSDAALFGAMTVALRFGFREGSARDAELGAFVCVATHRHCSHPSHIAHASRWARPSSPVSASSPPDPGPSPDGWLPRKAAASSELGEAPWASDPGCRARPDAEPLWMLRREGYRAGPTRLRATPFVVSGGGRDPV